MTVARRENGLDIEEYVAKTAGLLGARQKRNSPTQPESPEIAAGFGRNRGAFGGF